MPDFRKIDDPALQAQLAENYSFWDGMPGHASYRLACGACGRIFYARMPTARWCSDRCAREGAKHHRLARAAARREQWRSCRRCGKAFQGRRADAKFCSNACRQAAYRVTRRSSSQLCGTSIRNTASGGKPGLTKGVAKGTEGSLP